MTSVRERERQEVRQRRGTRIGATLGAAGMAQARRPARVGVVKEASCRPLRVVLGEIGHVADGRQRRGVVLSEAKGACPDACPLRFAQDDSLLTSYRSPLTAHPGQLASSASISRSAAV